MRQRQARELGLRKRGRRKSGVQIAARYLYNLIAHCFAAASDGAPANLADPMVIVL